MDGFVHDITLEERAKLQESGTFSISLEQGTYCIVPLRADLRALTKAQLSRIQHQFAKEPFMQLSFDGRIVALGAFQGLKYQPGAAQQLCALYRINKLYKRGV